jgi:hypothetical protein
MLREWACRNPVAAMAAQPTAEKVLMRHVKNGAVRVLGDFCALAFGAPSAAEVVSFVKEEADAAARGGGGGDAVQAVVARLLAYRSPGEHSLCVGTPQRDTAATATCSPTHAHPTDAAARGNEEVIIITDDDDEEEDEEVIVLE